VTQYDSNSNVEMDGDEIKTLILSGKTIQSLLNAFGANHAYEYHNDIQVVICADERQDAACPR
jgi:hypothetical protein